MIRKERVKGSGKVRVTFVLPKDQPHGKVSVVGDFNGWEPNKTPLVRRANQAYSAAITLEAGRRYAFRYITGKGIWLDEPEADAREPNGFGGENCVVVT
ncbi:MAG: isoamylase early set domain-containing protein [Candidatus Tectomicrobia bacterium]|uniref:Isoamylase early set domain-containing protein n=1 Tax=Tectimicrobiota bacterium TaxID=2528274 RepID=A0A932MP49_UNCTE|nr:isoamylase early set domain-containing protein [Candidatus Tectomicrobia bacterium]